MPAHCPALHCAVAVRRGITLLELLIVMLILLMITAAAIPIMAPAMRNRQMREATRLVSAYLGAAKARAVANRPPRWACRSSDSTATAFALQLSQVEVPPPYSGDFADSTTLGVTARVRLPQRDAREHVRVHGLISSGLR